MSFSDIIKKSVLKSFTEADLSAGNVAAVLVCTFLIALYIFFVYRFLTRSTFYNKNFAVSMAIISVITAGIILAMQSNFVISLGMVGALSIVRFRTAIKDPMDLLFLFWSISVGIVVGAGLFSVGIIMSAMVTIGLVILNMIPTMTAPKLLIVKFNSVGNEQAVMNILNERTSKHKIDSRTVTKNGVTLIVEVKSKDERGLVNELAAIEGMVTATLMEHDGEVKC